MSKAAWASVLLLGGGLGLTFFFVAGGIPDYIKSEVAQAEEEYKAKEKEYQAAEKALNAVIAKDKAYMETVPDVKALKKEILFN